MKPNRVFFLLLITMALGCHGSALWAEDWTTTDGKVYRDVKVLKKDAAFVTILHHDGGGQIALSKLTPDLQKRFNYDPVKAKAEAQRKVLADAANGKALQAEIDGASRQKSVSYFQSAPQSGESRRQTTEDSSDASFAEASDAPAAKQSFPYSSTLPVESLRALGLALPPGIDTSSGSDSTPAPADSSHHSIDDMTASMNSLRPSLSDPTYHTAAHMTYVINQEGLGPDTSDPNHHTMDQAVSP